MAEKRMLIVDAEVLAKIDLNRGELSRIELINFLLENMPEYQEDEENSQYLERSEFEDFSKEMRELLNRFLEFFISYGGQVGNQLTDFSIKDLTGKLQSISNNGSKAKSFK